ncbi:TPA: hypothetical protein NJ621_000713 [Vibrio parahaemolyticus]|nr:hypothetical protein [Vibrio parahaemolyticus]HCE3105900.1 hypothetical protein [Vibrio parahaemolyticus]HCG9200812.1 hypothetical protein [Vibrio parahaemolyticus]
MCNTKSVLHDATPSWNGYNYQGKVGLYVCLKLILEKVDQGISASDLEGYLKEHEIEYEWIEDFSIRKRDQYLTLHQVKHKGENKFSDHIEAISTILNRKSGVIPQSDIFRYFEFPKDKDESNGMEKEILRQITSHNLVDENWRLSPSWKISINNVDSIYKLQIFKCFSDFENLCNKAFINSKVYFHTVDDLKSPSKDIENYSGIPKGLIAGISNKRSLSCQNIYFSFDNIEKYDLSLSENILDKNIRLLISKLLNEFHSEKKFSADDIEIYKFVLSGLIDKHLVLRHKNIRDKINSCDEYFSRVRSGIKFISIVSELKKNFREQNSKYWNMICYDRFESAYNEFLNGVYNLTLGDNPYITEYEYFQCKGKLENYRMNVINKYLPNNFIDFLRTINPHEVMVENDDLFYSSITEKDRIKNILLSFIEQLTKSVEAVTLSCKNNVKVFQPSCISFNVNNEMHKAIAIDKARKGLADNYNVQSYINKDVDYIVVGNNENGKIPSGLEKFTEVENYDGSDRKNSITQGRDVFFINDEFALGEINE